MLNLFKKNATQQPVVEPAKVETKHVLTETLKNGSISLGKEIVAQTISSLIIIGAVNGFQYAANKYLEKKQLQFL